MDAMQVLVELSRRKVVIENKCGKLRFAPHGCVPAELKAAIRYNKAHLMRLLSNDPVNREERCQQYGDLIERVNAGFSGGLIDWRRLLDVAEPAIRNSHTVGELTLAMAEYEAIALPGVVANVPGTVDQPQTHSNKTLAS